MVDALFYCRTGGNLWRMIALTVFVVCSSRCFSSTTATAAAASASAASRDFQLIGIFF